MNVNDTEIVWSILQNAGYLKTCNIKEADIILLMTCAIRENAETKIWNKLEHLKAMKITRINVKKKVPLKIGILGTHFFIILNLVGANGFTSLSM